MRSLLTFLILSKMAAAGDVPPFPKHGHSVADGSDAQISVEVRFLTVSTEFAAAMRKPRPANPQQLSDESNFSFPSDVQTRGGLQLVSASTVVEHQTPISLNLLTDRAVKALVERAQRDPRTNLLFAPKALLLDGQTAEITDTAKRVFVTSISNLNGTPKPDQEEITVGTRIGMKVQKQPDNSVRMQLRVRLANVEEVLTHIDDVTGQALELPRVRKVDVEVAAEVPTGQTIVIQGIEQETEARVTKSHRILKIPVTKNTTIGREVQPLLILVTPRVQQGG